MTIINQKTHISSERDEKVLTNVVFNKDNGTLTFSKKDFYNNEDLTDIICNLNDIKLRIEVIPQSRLDELKNTQNLSDEDKIYRETHIFLVEFTSVTDTGEGYYREYVWSSTKNDFEVIGSTQIDLTPYFKKANVKNNLTTSDYEDGNGHPYALNAKQGYLLNQNKAPNNHASTATTYGVSTDTKYGHTKPFGYGENESISDISLTAGDKGTKTNEFAMGDHVHKHPAGKSKTGEPSATQATLDALSFGDSFKVTQFTSNATGHISAATDKTITFPSSLGNGTKAGLSTNDYTNSDKNKLNDLTIDTAISSTSTHTIQNKAVYSFVSDVLDEINTQLGGGN